MVPAGVKVEGFCKGRQMRTLVVVCVVTFVFSLNVSAKDRTQQRVVLSERLKTFGNLSAHRVHPVNDKKHPAPRMKTVWRQVFKDLSKTKLAPLEKGLFGPLLRSTAKRDLVHATDVHRDMALVVGSVFGLSGIRPGRKVAKAVQRVLDKYVETAMGRIADNPMESALDISYAIEVATAKGVRLPQQATEALTKIVKTISDGIESRRIQHDVYALSLRTGRRIPVTVLRACMRQIAAVTPDGAEIMQPLTAVLRLDR